jgi:hypothetical protein
MLKPRILVLRGVQTATKGMDRQMLHKLGDDCVALVETDSDENWDFVSFLLEWYWRQPEAFLRVRNVTYGDVLQQRECMNKLSFAQLSPQITTDEFVFLR